MPDETRTTADIATAARLLDVSVETLRKRLQRGRMDGVKAADGTWRVVLDEAQLEAAYLEKQDRRMPDMSGMEADFAAIRRGLDELTAEVRTLRHLLEAQRPAEAGGEALAAVEISRETAAELRHVLLDVLEFLRYSQSAQR